MCFFRNKDNKLCKLLLGIPKLIEHFGYIIGGEVLAVLRAFGIPSEKIGYFTLDNAEVILQPSKTGLRWQTSPRPVHRPHH
jgi:hypothetical protein